MHVKIWKVDYVNKKIGATSWSLGNLKRQITNVIIDSFDSFAYWTTKSGDLMEVNLEKLIFKRIGPVKKQFSLGITWIIQLLNGDLLLGWGDGTIAKLGLKDLNIKS